MAVVFKYKSPISQTYAPGMSSPGIAGSDGIKGKSGNALYFIDYDLDNSYNIDQALQKIENNKVLSINNNTDIKYREYKVNDIILTNTGKCYRIKENENYSFSNHLFDIEFLGELTHSNTCPVKFIVIYDFSNAIFYKEGTAIQNKYAGDIIKKYSIEEQSCYLTNRSEKPYCSKFSISNKDYSLCGAWIKIVGYSTEDNTPKFNPTTGEISGEKYSFVINLRNDKNIACDSIPVEYNSDVIQENETGGYSIHFNKKLEYPNIKTFDNISLQNNNFVNVLLNEIIPDNSIRLEEDEYGEYSLNEINENKEGLPAKDIRKFNRIPQCTTAYLSDYSLDVLHPSGNNIRCTINNDRTMWYKSGIKSGKNLTNIPYDLDSSLNYYKTMFSEVYDEVEEETEEIDFKIKKDILDSLQTYGSGLNFIPVNISLKEKIFKNNVESYINYNEDGITYDTSTSLLMTPNIFPKYAIGINLTNASENDLQNEINNLYKIGYVYDGKNLDNDYAYNSSETIFYTNLNKNKLMYVNTDDSSIVNNADKSIPDSKQPLITLKDVNGNNLLNAYLNELSTFNRTNSPKTVKTSYNIIKNVGEDVQFNNIIQFPKYYSKTKEDFITNYKGGNSLYFSGIDDIKDTSENIFNYVTDESNLYTIVTTFEKTKEMLTTDVPIIIDTSFKNSSVYVKFGQGKNLKTIIKGIRIVRNNKEIVNYTY